MCKIAVLISMMKLVGTMTTDVRVIVTGNLFSDNDVINLDRISLHKCEILGGAAWLVEGGSSHKSLITVVEVIRSLVTDRLPDYKMWLLVGNSTWQPDNRIVRHRRLWSALVARSVEVSQVPDKLEVTHESINGIKFFGALPVATLSVDAVVNVMLSERSTYLIALPAHIIPVNMLEVGWSGEVADDLLLFSQLFEAKGLLIKRSGEFDDVEKGVVVVGLPEIVMRLLGKPA